MQTPLSPQGEVSASQTLCLEIYKSRLLYVAIQKTHTHIILMLLLILYLKL